MVKTISSSVVFLAIFSIRFSDCDSPSNSLNYYSGTLSANINTAYDSIEAASQPFGHTKLRRSVLENGLIREMSPSRRVTRSPRDKTSDKPESSSDKSSKRSRKKKRVKVANQTSFVENGKHKRHRVEQTSTQTEGETRESGSGMEPSHHQYFNKTSQVTTVNTSVKKKRKRKGKGDNPSRTADDRTELNEKKEESSAKKAKRRKRKKAKKVKVVENELEGWGENQNDAKDPNVTDRPESETVSENNNVPPVDNGESMNSYPDSDSKSGSVEDDNSSLWGSNPDLIDLNTNKGKSHVIPTFEQRGSSSEEKFNRDDDGMSDNDDGEVTVTVTSAASRTSWSVFGNGTSVIRNMIFVEIQ